MINDRADEVIEELFQSILSRYQIGLEKSMKDSEFVFDCIHLLYQKYHKTNSNQSGSYIDSPNWIKNKAPINPINKNDIKCFQYDVTVALNHKTVGGQSERIIKVKHFLNRYNWEGINYPSEKEDWKKFEKNNLMMLLIFYMVKKKKYILPTFQDITQSADNKLLF